MRAEVTALPRADTPLHWRHRPRTRIGGAAARLANRFSAPRAAFSGTVEGLPLQLAPAGLAFAPATEGLDTVEIAFRVGEDGRLGLQVPAVVLARLVRAVQADLDPAPPPPTGPLLVELALAPLLDAAERIVGAGVAVESVAPAAPRPGAMLLLIDGAVAGERFPARLDLGPATADPAPALAAALALVEALPVRAALPPALAVPLAFQAGHVRLTLRQLERIRPGDAVLPDLWHPARGEIAVVVAGRQAGIARTDRHKATLKTPLRPAAMDAAAAREETGMVQERTSAAAPADADEQGLDAVSVTLAFELGRRSLTLAELREVGAGHVFDLGLAPDEPVDLVVNGARIGRGEIVEVGERIGVRVVRLFGRD